jgi:hypothetical protein
MNASGSGKTRMLLEGLCANWGFYFVCSRSTAFSLGSGDLPNVLNKMGIETGFNPIPANDQQIRNNEIIIQRHLVRVFAAQMIIMKEYLEHHRDIDISILRRRWLLFQALPLFDRFQQLARELWSFTDKFTYSLLRESAEAVRKMIGEGCNFFIVIDEAQAAADVFPRAFRGQTREERPALSKILITAQETQEFLSSRSTTIILSGTGIHYDTIKPILESNVAKDAGLDMVTCTGSFSKEAQESYIRKYLFLNVSDLSTSDRNFLKRAWRWLRGRFVFAFMVDFPSQSPLDSVSPRGSLRLRLFNRI